MQRNAEKSSDAVTKLSNAAKIIAIPVLGVGYKAGQALVNLPSSNPPNYAMSTAAAVSFCASLCWNRDIVSVLGTVYFAYAAASQYGKEKLMETGFSMFNGAKSYAGSFFGGQTAEARIPTPTQTPAPTAPTPSAPSL